ncbi:MAG: TetR/AcrR family transcriptional regulator [Clostridia bacterium]|nr:TetR/AcrR family transcriptional regulator [Clostridia bacterium]
MAAPRNEDLKRKIIDATTDLLKEKSFPYISLAEIAKNAGISKGTLYYYFKNKNEILLQIYDDYLDDQWKQLIDWTENKDKDTSLHRMLKYVIERSIVSPELRMHLIHESMFGNDDLKEKMNARYDQFKKLISGKIAERSSEYDPNELSLLILFLSDGLIVQKVLNNKNIDIDTFIQDFIDRLSK